MMSCNSIKNNPESLLETNIYRWNHDYKHMNDNSKEHKFRCRYESIEVKCIFKPNFFDDISDHHPIKPNYNIEIPNYNKKIVESVKNQTNKLDPFYNNLVFLYYNLVL